MGESVSAPSFLHNAGATGTLPALFGLALASAAKNVMIRDR
jgi:hypothetical protein